MKNKFSVFGAVFCAYMLGATAANGVSALVWLQLFLVVANLYIAGFFDSEDYSE